MSDTVATVKSSSVSTCLKQSKDTIIYYVYVHVHVDVGIQFHSFLILALDGGLRIQLQQIIIYKFY